MYKNHWCIQVYQFNKQEKYEKIPTDMLKRNLHQMCKTESNGKNENNK